MQLTDVARYWDGAGANAAHDHAYYSVPGIGAELNRRLSGDPELGYVEWFGRKYGHHFRDTAVLGCGTSGDELKLLKAGVAEHVTAVDISPASLEVAGRAARAAAVEGRVSFVLADACRPVFAKPMDLICAFGFVHHVEPLEEFFTRVREALAPNGLFFMLEYVGPTRMQWTPAQTALANTVLRRAPEHIRRSLRYPRWYRLAREGYRALGGETWGPWLGRLVGGPAGKLLARLEQHPAVKREVRAAPVHAIVAGDPSEAVRSADILDVLPRFLDVVERVDLGFSLVQPILDGLAGNFRAPAPTSQAWLQALYDADRRAVVEGQLPTDFAVVVARRPAREP